MERTVRKYTRLYQRAIRRRKLYDVSGKTRAYRDKLTELYASELYRQHSACRSMNPPRVYAIIAMILSLQSAGVEQAEIEAMVEETFCKAQKHIRRRTKLLDLYPGAWRIVRKRKIAAHKKHAGDGSMVFDSFEADDECVTYQVHRCMYVEMFAAYGIREYSRIFCRMERAADGFLPNHVWFVPYSDLLPGGADENTTRAADENGQDSADYYRLVYPDDYFDALWDAFQSDGGHRLAVHGGLGGFPPRQNALSVLRRSHPNAHRLLPVLRQRN